MLQCVVFDDLFSVPLESGGDFWFALEAVARSLCRPAQPPSSATKSARLLPMHCICHDRFFQDDPSHLHTHRISCPRLIDVLTASFASFPWSPFCRWSLSLVASFLSWLTCKDGFVILFPRLPLIPRRHVCVIFILLDPSPIPRVNARTKP